MEADSPPQPPSTCPICQEYFTEPVTLECGHNFCRACISQCWEGSDTDISCPQCRETVQRRNLRPNRQLANMVEIAKLLSLQAAKGAGEDGLCGEHLETLKLFCEEDQTPICIVCERSRAHHAHTLVSIQEAAQEYKVGNCCPVYLCHSAVCNLHCMKEAVQINDTPAWQERQQKDLQIRQKIVSEFQQLRKFLKEQKRLLLAQLEKLDEEIVRIQNENVSKLSKQISHLSKLISELEGKCQKPASEFLQVRRGETEAPIPWVLKVNVTLDPDTAHPQLVLSEDRKRVRRRDTRQQLPNKPERFDTWGCVLGCEGFTSGRHCWEVEVGDGRYWAVGVARESVRRKRQISLSPEGGIWAVGRWWGQFWALTSPETPLPLSRVPSRMRVCLDCDRGQVTFIDAGDEAPIFTFPPGSVPGGRIRPWFWVGLGSQLSLYP
uniref:Zinc finger protein RFP-like n=1 Tax=Chelonoidis abingdonii TaxID=106734 RepID=A0A8C0HDX2_CHEAB